MTDQTIQENPFAAKHGQFRMEGNVKIYDDLVQGSHEWFQARLGMLTASEMKKIVTPATMKEAKNDKARAHLYELAAQRISGFIEESYVGEDMERGWEDEEHALRAYSANYEPVTRVGFIVNEKLGFPIGYSPDALVGDEGSVEVKSRKQHFQIQTILEHLHLKDGKIDDEKTTIPKDFIVQVQTGLFVTERKWMDFISYSGGLPMTTIRVFPDPEIQDAIIRIATQFEAQIRVAHSKFRDLMDSDARFIETQRTTREEMHV